jgi:hypothetical protein
MMDVLMMRWDDSIITLTPAKRIYVSQGMVGCFFCMPEDSQRSLIIGKRESLSTSSLNPCVGVVMYHEQTHSGMLAHFDSDNGRTIDSTGKISEPKEATAGVMFKNLLDIFDKRLGLGGDYSKLEVHSYDSIINPDDPGRALNTSFVFSVNSIIGFVKKTCEDYGVICASHHFGGTEASNAIYLNLTAGIAGQYKETEEASGITLLPSEADGALARRTYPRSDNFYVFSLKAKELTLTHNHRLSSGKLDAAFYRQLECQRQRQRINPRSAHEQQGVVMPAVHQATAQSPSPPKSPSKDVG